MLFPWAIKMRREIRVLKRGEMSLNNERREKLKSPGGNLIWQHEISPSLNDAAAA